MPDPSAAFALEDPVHVLVGGQQLEGIIAYLGPVKFAEGNDWVGVRLTGKSVGKGKNDGSVRGERYFDTGDAMDSGVFVKKKTVSRRTLTRLEELRLKRALASPGATAVSTPVGRTGRSSLATSSVKKKEREKDVSDAGQQNDTKRRLDELRERRNAYGTGLPRTPASANAAKGRTSGATPVSVSNSTSSTIPLSSSRSRNTEDSTTILSTSKTTVSENGETAMSSPAARLEERKLKSSSAAAASASASSKKYEGLLAKYEDLEKENISLKQGIYHAEQSAEEAVEKLKQQQAKLDNLIQQQDSSPNKDTIEEGHASEKFTQLESHFQLERDTFLEQIAGKDQELQQQVAKYDALTASFNGLKEEVEEERRKQEEYRTSQEEANKMVAVLKSQMSAAADQAATRASAESESYKERARLQAEIASLKRQITELQENSQENERALEELTLDKEQALENIEELHEQNELISLDLESAKLEIEELKVELEESNSKSAGNEIPTASFADDMVAIKEGGNVVDSDDILKAMSVQNARLREAILRLREQANIEKMELQRALRAAEKDAAVGRETSSEVEKLRAKNESLDSENRELRESLDVSSAYEEMIEDLSAKMLTLEDDNAIQRQSIYELEEAAVLATEMEEVQTEEMKTLSRDLDASNVKIVTLEEAIKMQRKREDDFEITISKYRSSVETLKHEKQSLLAMVEGASGEKTELIEASQKAMSQAAALVENSSKLKKMEILCATRGFTVKTLEMKASRMEELLPEDFYYEVSRLKLEVLLSEVTDKANAILQHISNNFSSILGSLRQQQNTIDTSQDTSEFILEGRLIMISSKMRYASTQLLHIFLSEGEEDDRDEPSFARDVSTFFTKCNDDLNKALEMLIEEEIMASHIESMEDHVNSTQYTKLLENKNQLDGAKFGELTAFLDYMLKACLVLLSLSSKKEGDNDSLWAQKIQSLSLELATIKEVSPTAPFTFHSELELQTQKLFLSLSQVPSEGSVDETAIEKHVIAITDLFEKLKGFASSTECNKQCKHLISMYQNNKFSWEKFSAYLYLIYPGKELAVESRGRDTRERISKALSSASSLNDYKEKLDETRRTLSVRNVELSMQAKKISELDSLLSQRKTQEDSIAPVVTTETLDLKEKENKMLTEAMDVLQSQVDEYEAQIRALKDQPSKRSPSKRSSSRRASALLSVDELFESNINAEAALFRPVLQHALTEITKWRSMATKTALSQLPTLPQIDSCKESNNVNALAQPQEGGEIEEMISSTCKPDISRRLEEMTIASNMVRLTKARVLCVDLSKGCARQSLREQQASVLDATRRFESAYGSVSFCLGQ